ncbi:MAG: type II toxin-antitoxin system RelE/ParE family toxin [Candidatus Poribacteria bacterium]|nr:type II toxin-antitoxin system RelE/ParE family toxin [Candidatus Poribacteria bacterium]
MLHLRRQQILIYSLRNGRTPPYDRWYDSLDGSTKSRIVLRLSRVEKGNFGDCKSVDGIFELRFRGGFRIYFGRIDSSTILLLCGGSKSRQQRDVERAKTYWKEYQERKNE